jgi:type II secretory pathway pseudopilin PulG
MLHSGALHQDALARSGGFSLMELLVVISIVMLLVCMLFPIIGMLKESSRRQQARQVVSQLTDALREYASEDPSRNFPPQEPDLLIRGDPTNTTYRLLNAMEQLQMGGGLQQQVPDISGSGLRVLIDPWKRPYRYQLDNAGAGDPSKSVAPTRPDPDKLDWNARNLVPFGYVWSLGRPVHGQSAMWTSDPDAVPGTGAQWIYSVTAPVSTSP